MAGKWGQMTSPPAPLQMERGVAPLPTISSLWDIVPLWDNVCGDVPGFFKVIFILLWTVWDGI